MKALDIVIDMPTDNDLGETVTYESNDVTKILKVLIKNIDNFNISQSKIDYSIGMYLSKLQDKVIKKQYYKENKYIIDIILNIENALIGLSQTFQDENDVDLFDDEFQYIDTLEDVRDKLLFAVVKKIPELADDLLSYISSNYNNSIIYYVSPDFDKK